MKSGQFDRAGRILRFALKRFPDDHRLNALMGIWHAKRVEWVEAEQFLKRGVGGGSRDEASNISRTTLLSLDAVGILVEIWLCQGKAKEVVRMCDELLRQHPSPELLIWWAQGMDELGKTKEAAQRLERSQMFGRDERVARAAARLWELANEPEKAARVWERFAEIVPNKQAKLLALYQAAQVWERANAIPKALAVLEKAYRILDDPMLKAEKVRLMLKANAPAAALNEAEKLLNQFPQEPNGCEPLR
jgi:tetratricopeptide (TPR) repeat protein